MRNAAHYRRLISDGAPSVGISLAAAAVYAARYGVCEAEDRSSAAYRQIYHDMLARYGEALTSSEVLGEMDRPEPEIVSRTDIAERAGVSANTVSAWERRRDDFPQPVARTAGGAVYLWPQVEAWLRQTRRIVGDAE